MAVRSEALPETASSLSPPSGFESHLEHVGRLPVTCTKPVVFAGYSGRLHKCKLTFHNLTAIWQKN